MGDLVGERSAGGRDALIDAAIALVAESGLTRLTYRSLAAKAGVTHGSVQHHFESIDAVLEAALSRCLEISLAPLREVDSAHGYIDTLVESVKIAPQVHAFQYQLILESKQRKSLRPYVKSLYENYWSLTEQSLKDMGLEPDMELVRAVYAIGEGIVFQIVALGPDDPAGAANAIAGFRRMFEPIISGPAVTR
ncbi:TetR/AcrR family transcriptional regulator [Nocardioides sp. NPDC127503]|uniref:TetR/AcrR family transcriptional regulator n=1 Tax=Nocardioides sp. NPDC127503 TaxID=3154516 RepID=UPI003326FC91